MLEERRDCQMLKSISRPHWRGQKIVYFKLSSIIGVLRERKTVLYILRKWKASLPHSMLKANSVSASMLFQIKFFSPNHLINRGNRANAMVCGLTIAVVLWRWGLKTKMCFFRLNTKFTIQYRVHDSLSLPWRRIPAREEGSSGQPINFRNLRWH